MKGAFLIVDETSDSPPYRQIVDQLRAAIERGELQSEMLLPPVRQLAGDLGVAPNTVARAYAELQADGWLVGEGRRGTRVAPQVPRLPRQARARSLRESIEHFFSSLRNRGFTKDEIASELSRIIEASPPRPRCGKLARGCETTRGMIRIAAVLFATLFCVGSAAASSSDGVLNKALQRDLDGYLAARSKIEHVSAISLSVSLHAAAPINIVAGHTEYGGHEPITPLTLFQIGSNTKAFTAAIILQLEAEGVLTIDQTVGHWLPQYPAWKNVSIRRLLNMTSGIPTYDDDPAMLAAYAKNPRHNFTLAELIAYAYPTNPNAPKPTSGYSYSNTNYLLAELIIQRATHSSYKSELERRFFRSPDLGLNDTFYEPFEYPQSIVARMPAGYFLNNDPDNAPLAPIYGHDVRDDSVSWMQGAGGILSTPADLARWARALYTGPTLPAKQRAELLSLISTKTGEAIAKTSMQDPRGFGLGVAQMTIPQTGTIWFYEGESLGFRMVHFYLPHQDAVIAFGLNSRPIGSEDYVNRLALSVYTTLHAAGRL